MIAFIRNMMPPARPRIRLGRPSGMTLITGADREKIDAIFDAGNRVRHLIVVTKSKNLR